MSAADTTTAPTCGPGPDRTLTDGFGTASRAAFAMFRRRCQEGHRSLLVAVLLLTSGCSLQDTMLYYPSSYRPSPADLAARHLQLWPSGIPDDYRGYISTTPQGRPAGTIIVFHGNAGTASDRDYYVEALSPLGYRVLLAEYPGYGGREGRPGEAAFVRDAGETVQLVSKQYGGPLFLLGESLGCGVAAAVVKDPPAPIAGVILITPWDTLLSVAKSTFPWLPVSWFLKDAYDSVGNLRNYHGPIAVIGAERDEVIPVRHAEELYRSLPGMKKMWMIGRAGHNDWLERVNPAWWREIMEFVGGSQEAQAG